MALAEARKVVFERLERNMWQAEFRPDLSTKNLLAMGEVTADQVIEMLGECRESQYQMYPHLDDNRTITAKFVSVHPSSK